MTALGDARAHLLTAREFLEAAEVTLELDLPDAATSNAVTAGINAKDAICLRLTGRTAKSDDHRSATLELRAAGNLGQAVGTDFSRLIALKQRSQYQAATISPADAHKAVERARRLVEAAQACVTS